MTARVPDQPLRTADTSNVQRLKYIARSEPSEADPDASGGLCLRTEVGGSAQVRPVVTGVDVDGQRVDGEGDDLKGIEEPHRD